MRCVDVMRHSENCNHWSVLSLISLSIGLKMEIQQEGLVGLRSVLCGCVL